MRRAILLSLIILLSQPLVSATDITSNTDEDSSGTLSGNYTVKDGATWTISGNYEISEGTSIVVEEGSTMIVSGSMNATSQPQLNLASTANVSVPVGFLGETGILRINFAEQVLYPISVEIYNITTDNWTGSQLDISGIGMDVESLTVNITTHPFQPFIAISTITLSPQGSTPELRNADDLSGEGTSLVIPDRNNAWSIDVQGTLIVTGTIFGAGITCNGTCSLDGAAMSSTGPIEVYGSISVKDSTLQGGITDEDIIIWDDATVSWDNSTGTGGLTDNWVNILTTRTIGVQNGYVTFYGYDLGYQSVDVGPLNDNNTFTSSNQGDSVIEIATSEHDRMIRWQDGNGDLHTESATGKVVLVTPWGTYEHMISNLPKVNHFDMVLDLPQLSFDSLVASDSESDTNKRLGVMATVSNTGDASATFFFDCMANGSDANVGVSVPFTVDAGEVLDDIAMNWDSAVEGEFELECSIFVPYQLEGFNVLSKGNASTEAVVWSENTDESSNMVLPIAIGLVVAVVLFLVVSKMRVNSLVAKEELESKIEKRFEEMEDEDTGTID
jgi:hypothetical protein